MQMMLDPVNNNTATFFLDKQEDGGKIAIRILVSKHWADMAIICSTYF